MFVGINTTPLREWNFEKLVNWASAHKIRGLEVLVYPKAKQLDVEDVLSGKATKIKGVLARKNVEVTSLSFFSMNILESNKDQDFFKKVIEACAALDIGVTCTLAGRPLKGKDKKQTLQGDFPRVFNTFVDHAKAHGVRIALENYFATLLQGLEHFDLALESIPDKTLGFNFDPSHLLWQQIDYLQAVQKFGKRIYHTHAKDVEITGFKLRYVGVLADGWWRYRIPGRGELNWNAYITALKEVNYDYVLSIEHEDPFFGPDEGLLDGKRFLDTIIF